MQLNERCFSTRGPGGLSAAACGIAMFFVVSHAGAATINVTTASGVTANDNAGDGKCDLIEAVRAANTNVAYHGCTAGSSSGTDQIVLTSGFTYPLSRTLLPTSSIEITTSAAGTATISPTSWVYSATPGRECLIYARNSSSTVVTSLTGVTLSSPGTSGVAGFCNSRGKAILRRVHVTGFTAGGINSWCDSTHGCVYPAESSYIQVELSLIDYNSKAGHGGGLAASGLGSSLGIHNSSFIGNHSDSGGGAIWVGTSLGTPTIRHSTIASNSAAYGGGVYIAMDPTTNTYTMIFDSTIAHNYADSIGGVFLDDTSPGGGNSQDVHIVNSIINDNTSLDEYPNINNDELQSGVMNCYSQSIVYLTPGTPPLNVGEDSSCDFDTPMAGLGAPMPMGGNGLPVVPLLLGSAAIDANTEATGTRQVQGRDSWTEFDTMPASWQLLQRDVDGDGNGSVLMDVGAFEFNRLWQSEITKVHAVVDGTLNTEHVFTYSRGAGQKFAPGAACSGTASVTYAIPTAEIGRWWWAAVGVKRSSEAGKFRLALANFPNGPWLTSAEVNTYSPTTGASRVELGGFFLQSAGEKYAKLTVTGKGTTAAGGACNLFVDYIDLMPQ